MKLRKRKEPDGSDDSGGNGHSARLEEPDGSDARGGSRHSARLQGYAPATPTKKPKSIEVPDTSKRAKVVYVTKKRSEAARRLAVNSNDEEEELEPEPETEPAPEPEPEPETEPEPEPVDDTRTTFTGFRTALPTHKTVPDKPMSVASETLTPIETHEHASLTEQSVYSIQPEPSPNVSEMLEFIDTNTRTDGKPPGKNGLYDIEDSLNTPWVDTTEAPSPGLLLSMEDNDASFEDDCDGESAAILNCAPDDVHASNTAQVALASTPPLIQATTDVEAVVAAGTGTQLDCLPPLPSLDAQESAAATHHIITKNSKNSTKKLEEMAEEYQAKDAQEKLAAQFKEDLIFFEACIKVGFFAFSLCFNCGLINQDGLLQCATGAHRTVAMLLKLCARGLRWNANWRLIHFYERIRALAIWHWR